MYKEKRSLLLEVHQGFGAAIVEELCDLKINVVNADLREGTFTHENLVFSQTDVTSPESVEQTVATTVKKISNN